jgi:hypothetical protein
VGSGRPSRALKPDLKTIEPYDVSYAKLQPDGNWTETAQKVATAINVQFTESSEQLPFVPSKQFEKMLREEKIFLIGPSGSGKSRTIIELLNNRNASYERIFVINPSNPAGLDSDRANIATLSQQFSRNDLVIWDNFPEGLIKRDLQNAFGALEIVNASSVLNLYIALKPTYLEMYRGLTIGIPDIYTHEITCDLETMKALIKAYGRVEQYRDVFEKYVSGNTDRIAGILWQKQPLSLTVIDFYKALLDKTADKSQAGRVDETTAIQMAEAWLPVSDYFDRQFEVMKNIPTRKHDVELLYVLRFCYEVGFDRTLTTIARLQKGIFGSEPPEEPTRELGTWLYLSGKNYAMHDSAKNAIRLTDYSRIRIISYVVNNFPDILPKSEGELNPLGLFLGKNIQFVLSDIGQGLTVPTKIYEFMKKNAVFERAIGRGIGENFELLEDLTQQLILRLVDTELELGVGLADILGERFVELDDYSRKRVFEKIYQGMLFARYFGQSVGRRYSQLTSNFRALVISHTEKNPQFADGVGMGLGYSYTALDPALQHEIMDNAQRSFEISRGLGFGFGLTFAMLQDDDIKKMTALADTNSELDVGFGMGLAVSYANLPHNLRSFVLDRVANDCEFAFGVGIYAAFYYKESCPPDIFELLHSNTEVSAGLGLGYGTIFFYLREKFQAEFDLLLKTGVKLDDGFGSGMGIVLKHLPEIVQAKFFEKASASNAFAAGLGYGLGYTWQYIDQTLRTKAIGIASSNSDFAFGLGTGLGCHLDYLKPKFLNDVTFIADTNSEVDRGFGAGASWAWPYYSDDARRITIERIDTKSEFARGFGFGLARVVRHFSADESERLLDRLCSDPFFSEGFGEGTGHYLWSIYDEQKKMEFLLKAADSAEISRGVGAGIGFLYPFFKDELSGDTCQRLFNKHPNFRRGLGIGMGRAYKYLSVDALTDALKMAEKDVEFAVGLGQGIGMVYGYLDNAQKYLVLSRLGDNGYSRGLGFGFGLVLPYFGDDVKKHILAFAAHNKQLSLGIGAAVATRISYLSEPVAFSIFELARNNRYLAAGLGEGCGTVFYKLSRATKDRLSAWIDIDGFAFGFGTGIGKIRRYLDSNFNEATGFVNSNEFAEGLAIGLGSSVAYLPKEMLLETLSKYADRNFKKSFGFAFGHFILQLDENKRNVVFEMMKGDQDFLAGLGEGFGHNLPVTGSGPVEEIMQTLNSVDFAKGVAKGVVESFKHLDLAEVYGMVEYASSRAEYGKILGGGLAEKFASFDEDKQSQILEALRKNTDFSKEFAKAIKRNLVYTSAQSQERIKRLFTETPHLNDLVDERRISS